MTTFKKLKIGVMGCAAIADRSVIPAILDSPNFELIAIASRDKLKAKQFSEKFNCEAVIGYQNLIDRNDIDVIYMPLPTGLHEEWIIKSLNANKHIHVEKSFGMNLQSTKLMVDLAREKRLIIMENFQFIHHSQHLEIKKLIDSGKIGELRSIRGSFGFPPLAANNFRYNKELGGGALLDAGAYMLKVSQMLIDDSVYVDSAFLHYNENSVDIFGGGMLKSVHQNIFAQVAFGFDHFYQCNYELWGSKGKLTAHRAYTANPGFSPTISVETNDGNELITLPSDNHFVNILNHFYKTLISKQFNDEYVKIIKQATLIDQFIKKSNG